ncbi:MAG: glycine cleavage system aminomethyltransferase GcvT [Deltaproteobacteria bacterium]|nr:glycine cleavage system aminomethyltransferase GcvT [Deltaproteobacteria bacterium]MBN2674075.1 glycine cleavage system aminomethyltransferase GcvT [Deltaproteobacteria bacterium]
MDTALLKTPLNEEIKNLGAKMVSYAGYEMPVRFGSIKEEHNAVRNAAGIFDVSHMTEFWLEGENALAAANYLVTNDLTAVSDGQMQYSLMCTEHGTVVDDLMVYRFSPTKILLVMNAACKAQDLAHIQANLNVEVTFTDRSLDTAQVALQGPRAVQIMNDVTAAFSSLASMHFTEGTIAGHACLVSRSGYTGEDGYEIYCANDSAVSVFSAIVEAGKPHGLQPVGLGARDTLRLEAKMPLYGNELSLSRTPLEARLKWAVALDKTDFLGKSALVAQQREGIGVKLVGFEMTEKAIPRHGYPVVGLAGEQVVVGEVTSGCPSPTLGTNIGLAYVPTSGFKVGTEIGIEIRGNIKRAKIVKTPFYKRSRS